MTDTVLRLFAILIMCGVIVSAGQMIIWLASAWIPSKAISLSVQAFDISRGEKVAKEEGKQLAARFVAKIKQIQAVMSADLTDLNEPNQVRVESALPKSLLLQPDVPSKLDVSVKAFDVDVVGILESMYKFFDRSDRLAVSMTAGEKIRVFASFTPGNPVHSIGPWWLDGEQNEQATIDKLAYQFSLDLYKTEVQGLDGLDAKSFAKLVATLAEYQKYVRTRHANAANANQALLQSVRTALENISKQAKTSALAYSYLGSTLSLQNETDAAITAYGKAKELNSNDQFAEKEIARLSEAKALQPVKATGATAGSALASIKSQNLEGYFSSVPASLRAIKVAIVGTGISRELAAELGSRLVTSISVTDETSGDDVQGHGTSVVSRVAALAPDAQIISIKGLSSSGAGTLDFINSAIKKAVELHADVILLPLGTPVGSPTLQAAVTEALKAKALVVAAAGNSGGDSPSYPAAYQGVLAAGALDNKGQRLASFTNRGPNVVYAPGEKIRVMTLEGLADQSGTSFSASIVAAIGAVIWSAKPDLSAAQIKELIESSSAHLRSSPDKSGTGVIRRIDAIAALR